MYFWRFIQMILAALGVLCIFAHCCTKMCGIKYSFFKKMKLRRFLIVAGIALGSFGTLAFTDGFFDISKNLETFAMLYKEVNSYYVDDINASKIMRVGIDAMLKTLDPYTVFISESEIEDFRFQATGQYGGIGALVANRNGKVIITEPYEGFSAQKNDIRAGDVVLEIDGKSTQNKNSDEIGELLKGQPNTPLTLKIQREGTAEYITKNLKREEITIKSVVYSGVLEGNTGYIFLDGFKVDAAREVSEAFLNLKTKYQIKQLILDLRSNPGGSLDEAVNIAGIFIPKGSLVVTTKGKNKQWDKTYKTLQEPLDPKMPLVVLINENSASASEIIAGVVQDYDRGVIVGQNSFGKGLVQTVRPLAYNTQLKVTTAKYYTPSGRCIQELNYAAERDANGKAQEIPDSLRRSFTTSHGRTVLDGKGIAPDLAMPSQTYSEITETLLTKYLVFDFATQYHLKNPKITNAKNFRLSQEEYADFLSFIANKDYSYQTESEKTLNAYKQKAILEKYFDDVSQQFDAMKTQLAAAKAKDLQTHQAEIKAFIEEEIVARYYFQKGKIENRLFADDEITEAIKILNDPAGYQKILRK